MSSLEIEILVVPRDGLAPALHVSRAAVPAASFAEACTLLGVEGAQWMNRVLPASLCDPAAGFR